MKKINSLSFKDLIDISVNYDSDIPENKEIDFNMEVDGVLYQCYDCSISNRDLLLFSDKGTLNYVIDTIGFNNYAELYSIDE